MTTRIEWTEKTWGFNPSVGILWGLASSSPASPIQTRPSFNPSVGILWGLALRWCSPKRGQRFRRFNPSVGILWGLAQRRTQYARLDGKFQSLGRDSVGFSRRIRFGSAYRWRCFNPSVGILWGLVHGAIVDELHAHKFQSLGRDSVGFSRCG